MMQVHQLKRELLSLRRLIWPHREAMAHLSREESPLFEPGTRIFFRDSYDHVVQLVDLVETFRELAADLRDFHMTSVNNRINETMRVLTIIATIFIPITFIASIYGMNFQPEASPWNMPELKWYFGYPFALGLMAVTALGLILYFVRQGWMRWGTGEEENGNSK
jgi:magnesium transporter